MALSAECNTGRWALCEPLWCQVLNEHAQRRECADGEGMAAAIRSEAPRRGTTKKRREALDKRLRREDAQRGDAPAMPHTVHSCQWH